MHVCDRRSIISLAPTFQRWFNNVPTTPSTSRWTIFISRREPVQPSTSNAKNSNDLINNVFSGLPLDAEPTSSRQSSIQNHVTTRGTAAQSIQNSEKGSPSNASRYGINNNAALDSMGFNHNGGKSQKPSTIDHADPKLQHSANEQALSTSHTIIKKPTIQTVQATRESTSSNFSPQSKFGDRINRFQTPINSIQALNSETTSTTTPKLNNETAFRANKQEI